MVNIYRLPDEQPQATRLPEMPFGTRGGLAVRSHFPLDGEYLGKVQLAGASSEPQQLEIKEDGGRFQLATIARGGGPGGGGFVGRRGADEARARLRLPRKGARTVCRRMQMAPDAGEAAQPGGSNSAFR